VSTANTLTAVIARDLLIAKHRIHAQCNYDGLILRTNSPLSVAILDPGRDGMITEQISKPRRRTVKMYASAGAIIG